MANYTILLIDYEPRSIERFREPLLAAGYTIEIATDGVSGIEAFHRLNPDMVLVEAMIPKKHGFEVCQELKRTPHGRQTPVLITTGVYKGRKYRTQALHIYGCDEYIEKPIAPEQLLKIVGKFFGSSASAPAAKAAESAPESPEDEAGPHEQVTRGSSSEPSARQRTAANDGAEDEISARLDAILPGGGHPAEVFAEHDALAAVVDVADVTDVNDDPFAQMRAELNAELGSLSAALAYEPTLAPSDQVVAPSVLEALPSPEADIAIVPSVPSTPAPPRVADEKPGQVVDFAAKRGRKNKKPERQSATRLPKAARVAPSPETAALTLPRNTLVASELDPTAGRSGMPTWIWAALGVVAIVTIYFVFPRSGVGGGDAVTSPPASAESIAIAPAKTTASPEAKTPPAKNAPIETASAVPKAPESVPASSKPVREALAVPAPQKAPVAKPPVAATAKAVPPKIDPKLKPAKESAPVVAAPSSVDEAVAGVEAVPDTPASTPTATISPGTLIAIDEADTMPIVLSHQVPAFSLQARQMRLSGTVVMNVLVSERGTVEQVVLVTGVSGAGVNDAAMRAAESWTYRPATKNGVPVKVWKSEQIVFRL